MLRLLPGLVSITFRSLSPAQVIELAQQGGMKLIEWGGDVHAPPGDLARARALERQSREAGMACAAYGSYYRLGSHEGASFQSVLETAITLGAPTIRVWAGTTGSGKITREERLLVLKDIERTSEFARSEGLTLSLEYHANTLTDTRDSVRMLMRDIPNPNVEFLWQPVTGETYEQGVGRLQDVVPRLRHVHVFHWWPEIADRLPLAEGENRWQNYLRILRESGREIPCLLEFVRNDSPAQFLQDAATLSRWLVKEGS